MILLQVYDFSILFMIGAGIALVSLLLALPISETMTSHPKTPLFSREALFASTLMFTVSLTYGSLVSFLSLFAQKQGITNPGVFFTVFAVTLVLVRALAGKLSDKKGRKFVILPGMILAASGLWVLSTASELSVFLIAALLYGLGFGLVHPSLMALLVDSVSEEGRGAAMGTFSASFDLGIGMGSIILGFVLQYFGFQVMYSISALIVLAGAVLLMADNKKASRRT